MKTDKYKTSLETELQTLEAELKTVGRRNPSNPNDWQATPAPVDVLPSDDQEVAESIDEFEENSAILKQLEIRFNEVKTALERIKDGTFGTCTVCAKPIEEKRLDANPAATTCIEHKEG